MPLTDHDIYLFKQGQHFRLYEKLGSHLANNGADFGVWAPNAKAISVIGDFNDWNPAAHPLRLRSDDSGIWEGFVPDVGQGATYKYHIVSRYNKYVVDKGDPYAFRWEKPPETASVIWDLNYEWGDQNWSTNRSKHNSIESPFSIYEVHLGSWKRRKEDGNRFFSYRENAHELSDYVKQMGFTHIELMPVMEHPFYGSWGYQQTGYFAPTSRYGTPQDFMYFVDQMHQAGIGVILDWVPSHFPQNENGLIYFDGTNLYEHADPRKGYHPDWKSYIFNYGRWEVREFLISSALFWLEKYHIDALRVDGVASMLYLDYSRKEGEWVPNKFGGRENLEAVEFLKTFNHAVYENYPDVQTIAEESTAWPMVSRPTYLGGLGFGMKWNMGWMHDTLDYFSRDPIHRKYAHNNITFSIWYAFSENFILSLSHDEVVHMKGSLMNKMPGDAWQKAANLRSLFGYMYAHPGKKLLFMGAEFGMWREWNHDSSLDWDLLEFPLHFGIQKWMNDLNHFYRNEPALYEVDFQHQGFEWMDFHDWDQSIISFVRKDKSAKRMVLIVCNFTPVPRHEYEVPVPRAGYWKEVLNSDATEYAGTGQGNYGGCESSPSASKASGKSDSLSLTLPSLSVLYFTLEEHESTQPEESKSEE